MATWPAFMPQQPVYSNINISGPIGSGIRTNMSAGPAKQRRRFTAAPRSAPLVAAPITQADFALFEDWFENDLDMGTLEFDMPHPVTDVMKSWRFDLSQTPYSITPVGLDAYSLSLTLEIMP